MAIYFTRCDSGKLITILRLYYHELIRMTEEHEGKNHLMIDDFVLDRLLHKIKKVTRTEKIDNTKILIDTDDKL